MSSCFPMILPLKNHIFDGGSSTNPRLPARILRDATRLMRRHIGATKSIQQGGFAMVDVTQPEQSRDDTLW